MHGGFDVRCAGCYSSVCKCTARPAIEGAFARVLIASTGSEERTFEILCAANECRSQELSGATFSTGGTACTADAAIPGYGLAYAQPALRAGSTVRNAKVATELCFEACS